MGFDLMELSYLPLEQGGALTCPLGIIPLVIGVEGLATKEILRKL